MPSERMAFFRYWPTSKGELSSLAVIKRLSRDFNGHSTDTEVMAITGLYRNTYYKYKAKLRGI